MASLLGNPVASTDDAMRRRSESQTGYLPEDEETLKALNFLQLDNGQWVLNRRLNLAKEDITAFLNWYVGPKTPPFPPVVRRVLCLNRAKLKNVLSNIGTSNNLRTGTQQKLAAIEDLLKKDSGEKPIPDDAEQCAAIVSAFVPPGVPGAEMKPAAICPECPTPQTVSATQSRPSNAPTPVAAGYYMTQHCDIASLGVPIGEIKAMLERLLAGMTGPGRATIEPLANALNNFQDLGNNNVPDIDELLANLQARYAGFEPITDAIASVREHANDDSYIAKLLELRDAMLDYNINPNQSRNVELLKQLDALIKSLQTAQTARATVHNLRNLESQHGLTEEQLKTLLQAALAPLMDILEEYGAELNGIRSNIGDVKTNIAGVQTTLSEQGSQLASIREALAELRAVQEEDIVRLKRYLTTHLEVIEGQMSDYKELVLARQQDNAEALIQLIQESFEQLMARMPAKNAGNVSPSEEGDDDGNGPGDGPDDLQGELDRLTERLMQQTAAIQGHDMAIHERESRIAALQTQLEGLQRANSPNKARITVLESEAQRNSQLKTDLQAEINTLQAEIEGIRASTETERAAAASTITRLEEEKAALQRLLDNCLETKTALEAIIQEKTSEVQALQERIAELEALPPQNDVGIETLRQSLEGKTQELLTVREQFDDMESMQRSIEGQLRDCNESKAALQSALERCEQNSSSKNAQYKSELEKARKKAHTLLEARQKDYESQIMKLSAKHSEIVRRLSEEFAFDLDEQLEVERSKCKDIQAKYTTDLAEKNARIAQLESELQTRPADCEELESRVAELEGLIVQKDSELQTRIADCEKLESRVAELEGLLNLHESAEPQPRDVVLPEESIGRLVALPEFLSNFKDIQIKIKPDLAIGLKRIFRSQRQKNTHQEGVEAAIDSQIRDAVYEILSIMGPSSVDIAHDRLETLLTIILNHPAFKEFAEQNAAELNITTPMQVEEMSYKLLKYIVDEAHKAMGGMTRRKNKISRNSTRRR